jgi:anti-anti-sigma factor
MAQLDTSPVSARRRAPPVIGASGGPPAARMVGEFDPSTLRALSAMFSSAIADGDADLVVDLSEVSFMDASTISVIIRTNAFLGVHGRLLRLRDPSVCARRLLALCDLDELIEGEARANLSTVGVTPVDFRPRAATPMHERR